MSIYLIAEINVHDPEAYGEYVRQARPLIVQHGGQYRVQGGEPKTISGGWTPERIVMIEFPSEAAFRQCFGSDAYRQIAPLRERSTTSRAIMVRAYDDEEDTEK